MLSWGQLVCSKELFLVYNIVFLKIQGVLVILFSWNCLQCSTPLNMPTCLWDVHTLQVSYLLVQSCQLCFWDVLQKWKVLAPLLSCDCDAPGPLCPVRGILTAVLTQLVSWAQVTGRPAAVPPPLFPRESPHLSVYLAIFLGSLSLFFIHWFWLWRCVPNDQVMMISK